MRKFYPYLFKPPNTYEYSIWTKKSEIPDKIKYTTNKPTYYSNDFQFFQKDKKLFKRVKIFVIGDYLKVKTSKIERYVLLTLVHLNSTETLELSKQRFDITLNFWRSKVVLSTDNSKDYFFLKEILRQKCVLNDFERKYKRLKKLGQGSVGTVIFFFIRLIKLKI